MLNVTMMETVAREQHDSRLKQAKHNRVLRQVAAGKSQPQSRRSSRRGGLFNLLTFQELTLLRREIQKSR